MNEVLRDALERGARSVDNADLRLEAVLTDGEQRLRRRRLGAVAGTALAVALVIAAPAVVTDFGDEPRSVDRPGPVEPTEEADPAPRIRPIVYIDGSTLHVGDRTIDVGFTPPFRKPDFHTITKDSLGGLWATDEGAVFATYDGRIWFSDGREMEQVGFVSGSTGSRGGWSFAHGHPLEWIQTDPAGSRALWVEYPSDRPELVVYDTDEREVQVRVPLALPPRRRFSADWEVYGNHVYWRHYGAQDTLRTRLMRTSITTREIEPATDAMIATERQLMGRTLMLGRGQDRKMATDRDQQTFMVSGRRLEAATWNGDLNTLVALPVIHPNSGERREFRAPTGLPSTPVTRGETALVLFQWIDDDRFVLSSSPSHGLERRDILVCRISTERCEITERKGRGSWLVLPGVGMPG